MATATNQPIKSGGSISVIEDDGEEPFAIQISHDLAALSVRMSRQEMAVFVNICATALHEHDTGLEHIEYTYNPNDR